MNGGLNLHFLIAFAMLNPQDYFKPGEENELFILV